MGKVFISLGGGGGVGSDELTATLEDVLKGKTVVASDTGDEIGTGTLELTGDAAVGNVLSGKTFYGTDAKTKLTGTMPNNGAVAPSALGAGGSYTIPAGYHNGSGKVTVQTLATMTASGDATAAQILSGKKAYVDGSLITGSMTDRGAQTKTITPSASAQSYTILAGYHNGSGKVSVPAVSNLTAANIKKGVVVGGVTGTWSGYVATATDLYLRGNNIAGFTKSSVSITFESGAIYYNEQSANGLGITTTTNYDLSPYTYLNVEFYSPAASNGYVRVNLYDDANGDGFVTSNMTTEKLGSKIISASSAGTYTISVDVSLVNRTAKGLWVDIERCGSSSGSSTGPFSGQIYRIWLS